MPDALPRTATCAVRVDAVHHADVAHVLHAADDEDITVTGHDRLRSGAQRAYRGTAQAAHGLTGRRVRDLRHQGS